MHHNRRVYFKLNKKKKKVRIGHQHTLKVNGERVDRSLSLCTPTHEVESPHFHHKIFFVMTLTKTKDQDFQACVRASLKESK